MVDTDVAARLFPESKPAFFKGGEMATRRLEEGVRRVEG